MCDSVQRAVCAAQRCAFQGQRQRVAKVLCKCCTTLESATVCVCACVCAHLWSMSSSSCCYCKLAAFCNANARQMAIANSQWAIGNSPAQHAACCLLAATCHLPPAAPPRDCVCVTFGRKVQATSSSDVSAGPASTRAQQFVSLRLSSLV